MLENKSKPLSLVPNTAAPQTFRDYDQCVDAILQKVGKEVHFGMPLGLGKPINLINAFYQRACKDPSIRLHIATAISLEKPAGKQSLEKRFFGPFSHRLFGDIPDLLYVKDLRAGKLPENVRISEFFFKAGSYTNDDVQQQNHICTNYTHAVRDLMGLGVNVVAQIVAPHPQGEEKVSLSCNPDLSLDLLPALRQREAAGQPVAIIAEINRRLPYFAHHAELPTHAFDFVVDNVAREYPLFGAPNMAIAPADHLIGFYASSLLRDGGTLQVGIGSLGSALVYSTLLRHQDNARYRALLDELKVFDKFPVARQIGGDDIFNEGLYGCSEMMVDGFIHLLKAGVLKRAVYDDVDLQRLLNEGLVKPEVSAQTLDVLVDAGVIGMTLHARDVTWLKRYGVFHAGVQWKGGRLLVDEHSITPTLDNEHDRDEINRYCLGSQLKGGVVMHGGFYLGPADFYQALRDLTDQQRDAICMSSVNYINHLYDHFLGGQAIKVVQRKDSRFINSTMMYTLNGAAVSDGLANGRVISGVGGQYNFVAMAHELPDARSILKLRSTRGAGKNLQSNIVFNYAHCTIPRHLRDIVVTEYGIADLRGKSDQAVYLELIKIADSRFQDALLAQAKKAGKVSPAATIGAAYRDNRPEKIAELVKRQQADGCFGAFPFGCDFTTEELRLGKALKNLKAATASPMGKVMTILRALRIKEVPVELRPLLARMDLEHPQGLKAQLEQKLLVSALLAS